MDLDAVCDIDGIAVLGILPNYTNSPALPKLCKIPNDLVEAKTRLICIVSSC